MDDDRRDLGPRLALELARLGEAGHHLAAVAGAALELAGPEVEAGLVGLPVEDVAVHAAHELRVVQVAVRSA